MRVIEKWLLTCTDVIIFIIIVSNHEYDNDMIAKFQKSWLCYLLSLLLLHATTMAKKSFQKSMIIRRHNVTPFESQSRRRLISKILLKKMEMS